MAKLKTTPTATEEEGAAMATEAASIASDGVTDPPVANIENEDTDSGDGEVNPNPAPDPAPTLALSVTTKSVGETAGSFNVNITSNSDWTTSGVPNWITLTPSSGNGDKTVKVAYTANTAYTQRSKAITFSVGELTQTLNVTQAAAPEPPPPPTPEPDPKPDGEEPDDFADQILKCFPREELMYIDRQGGLYVQNTKEHIRGKAVLYTNPYYRGD